jgi:hypothetical protein
MSRAHSYWELPGLDQIYLEDSYVLAIHQDDTRVSFDMELVLREGHPLYRRPDPSSMYCYRRGRLVLDGGRDLRWLEKRDVQSWDARGEEDLGNVDIFYREGDVFTLQGDWGKVQVTGAEVKIEFEGVS